MKTALGIGIVLSALSLTSAVPEQTAAPAAGSKLKVILLGTAGGPTIDPDRLGISTLVVAGSEQLLFDAGRGLTFGLARLSIRASTITKLFLTHLHSDHIVSIPELYLFPWGSQGRKTSLQIWGPEGTRAMTEHLRDAFAFDIQVRRDVLSPEGITILATDVREGVVYDTAGVKVTAFLVDHGVVAPALGYRIEYGGRTVVLSGDTKFSPALIANARGADLLVHEVVLAPADVGPSAPYYRAFAHHTTPEQAAEVFTRARPALAVYSHIVVFGGREEAEIMNRTRPGYAGPVLLGQDLMSIAVGDTLATPRPRAPAAAPRP